GHALSRKWLQVDGCITANQFIPGTPAMCLVVAVNGTVLAALTAVKERSFPEQTGPSSVVRFVPNAEMRRTAAELTSAWKLTGFIGYDFILDSDGAAWLIECNPRPTPIAHLGALAGEDLCAALFNHLTSRPPVPVAIRSGLVVAHFPQEMARDAASPFLTDGYHDVPEDDPELMHLMLRKSR
ncbi:MAG TPA: ATP-grasp domain-containing protein, partial [Candidatus Paceibacterota bacterium]|nr:ATP-grasp domain-containing protein [Candidatus Paceibacterota bacterium]